MAGPALAQINAGLPGVAKPTATAMPASPLTIRPDLFRRALAALQRHGSQIKYRDKMALVDFDLSSSQPRFHLVDLASGRSKSLLVAHGRGSDPEHIGYLTRFSNEMGSNCSSQGTYLTSDIYVGQHGRSRRLLGLDATNSNVEPRNVVVHAAWYVSPDMIAQHGKLGRSEGCFALSTADLEETLAALGPGRMIYADKV
ncbi:murein L,D-transpeptidase catalytic domain family protein [Sphingomonas sp. MAHUQ-71]|uniref:Murein L,D-transpeptidase catalytic domain family protein n=1 Tax=Sphingomonas oryzagri TaxID=3042314 RepID=A0ABT6N743_9SPHN|nr:murein L,D-transpeptidase catalytic domain family protein [Sphingomonas oryzagri]